MTVSQKALYWRMWGRCRQVLIKKAGFSPADADAQRRELTVEALGYHRSSNQLTNREFDAVLDAFRNVLLFVDGLDWGPTRVESMPRKRLIMAIERTGLPDPYLQAIAADQFGPRDWRALPEDHLRFLAMTAGSRSRKRRKSAVSGSGAEKKQPPDP